MQCMVKTKPNKTSTLYIEKQLLCHNYNKTIWSVVFRSNSSAPASHQLLEQSAQPTNQKNTPTQTVLFMLSSTVGPPKHEATPIVSRQNPTKTREKLATVVTGNTISCTHRDWRYFEVFSVMFRVGWHFLTIL